MTRKILIGIIILLLAAGGGFWYWRSRSDEAQIRKVFKNLCYAASKPQGENAASGALKLQRLDQMVAPKLTLRIRYSFIDGTLSPQELAGNIARFRPMFQWLTVDLRDLAVTVDENGETASAVFTGTLHALSKNNIRYHEVRDLSAVLQKNDGKWLVSELSISDILEK